MGYGRFNATRDHDSIRLMMDSALTASGSYHHSTELNTQAHCKTDVTIKEIYLAPLGVTRGGE
jgi:hypothetical protein